MSFPPPPVNTIDWSDIGFRVREGNCFEVSLEFHPALCNCTDLETHMVLLVGPNKALNARKVVKL